MAAPGPADTEKAMKMAQQEMDYRVDLYNSHDAMIDSASNLIEAADSEVEGKAASLAYPTNGARHSYLQQEKNLDEFWQAAGDIEV
ncbi:MAG: hypothetical protein FRX49_11648 [Trebouxia sp. A1-2]|nr:MAG: hypothetical protein FRX49_11648 [Trebouxia sp. A1-2]